MSFKVEIVHHGSPTGFEIYVNETLDMFTNQNKEVVDIKYSFGKDTCDEPRYTAMIIYKI